MMREELSEKVETVYAEEYAWPLGLASAPDPSHGEAPARVDEAPAVERLGHERAEEGAQAQREAHARSPCSRSVCRSRRAGGARRARSTARRRR